MRFAALFSLIAALGALAACDLQGSGDDDWMTPDEALPDIRGHVETFLAEADERGRTGALYKPDELRVVVDASLTRNGEELCGFGEVDSTTNRPTIALAISENCWDRPEWDREIIVFHELGHALLGRTHRDDLLPNGLRASIMNSGNIFGLYSETRADHRAYYIDELFDATTEVPTWGL